MAKTGTRRRNVHGPHRIAVHDYAGHPFQFELSRELARRGHHVRHFFFAEDAGPKGTVQRLQDDPAGFSVEPISIGRSYSKTNLIHRRQADVLYGRLAGQRIEAFAPTVTISGNAPLEAQASIMRSVRRMSSAFIFWMQDFYSLAAAKILRRKIPVVGHVVGAYYKHLEAQMLRQSDGIVLISEDFKHALHKLGVRGDKAEVIPNWGSLAELSMRPKRNAWAREHGLEDKFVFLYSGTLALKHNPDLLWKLAKHFERDPSVLVLVVGTGVSFESLKVRREASALPNLMLLPLQPMEVFADVLASADVLVALLEDNAGPFAVPSKVLNYLCAGRPVLLSAPSDNLSVRVIAQAAAGECVPAEQEEAFIEAADRLRGRPELRAELGDAARAYAEGVFNISAIADRFEGVFNAAVSRAEAGGPRSAPLLPGQPARI